jgi:hypothetical protein
MSFSCEPACADRVEKGLQTQRSLLPALWHLMNPTSRDAIPSFSRAEDVPAESAQYARGLLARRAGIGMSLMSQESHSAECTRVMHRPISDEALREFDALTFKLVAKL